MEELSRLRNVLQYSFSVLNRAIGNVRAEHQAKVPRFVHLTEHSELLLVTPGVPFLKSPWMVAKTNLRTTETKCVTAEVKVPVDDNDVEGHRKCGRGEHGFEEIRCGVLSEIDCFCRGLKCPEALVPR